MAARHFATPHTCIARRIVTLGQPETNTHLSTLILLSALSVLPVNLILPTLPDIAESFESSYWVLNLSITLHAVVAAITQVVGGSMSDRFGRRPVALGSILLFILASLGCAMAGTIGEFLIFRALQAPIIVCYSIALATLHDASNDRHATSGIGYVSMAWAIAPMLGPTLGGQWGDLFGWRANFLAFSLVGLLLWVVTRLDLMEPGFQPQRPTQSGSFVATYRQLLTSPSFLRHTVCMMFCIGTLYIFLGWAPLAVSNATHGSNTRLGILMGLIPAGFIAGSFLAGCFGRRMSVSTTILLGRLITCVGLLAGWILLLQGDVPYLPAFFGSCLFIGVGNGLSMAALNAGVLSAHQANPVTASALAGALTTTGGVSMAALCGFWITDNNAAYGVHGALFASASVALIVAIRIVHAERNASYAPAHHAGE